MVTHDATNIRHVVTIATCSLGVHQTRKEYRLSRVDGIAFSNVGTVDKSVALVCIVYHKTMVSRQEGRCQYRPS